VAGGRRGTSASGELALAVVKFPLERKATPVRARFIAASTWRDAHAGRLDHPLKPSGTSGSQRTYKFPDH
jgi:hypothetical protein